MHLISLLFLVFSFTHLQANRLSQVEYFTSFYDDSIHSLASLAFYLCEEEKNLKNSPTSPNNLLFSDEEVSFLWNKIHHALSSPSLCLKQLPKLHQAFKHYEEQKKYRACEETENAKESLEKSLDFINQIWEEMIELEDIYFFPLYSMSYKKKEYKKRDPNFVNNPHLSSKAEKEMKPHLLPLKHPMRPVLDDLCLNKRVTQDQKTFSEAGFVTLAKRPRSFIRVAKHEDLPGYLVKVYLDTVLQEKFNKESWKWLVLRCIGADKIRHIIRKRRIEHFVVPNKWIYCLPPHPSPPSDFAHVRHLALLLVTDMNLVSKRENYRAWKYEITKKHLEELYAIISRARGSSYRPDNIAYTQNGTFAFIDTEYPNKGPDFNSIRKHLSPKMRDYWDQLVKQGGN